MEYHKVWSKSRRELFLACPRWWIIRYGINQGNWDRSTSKKWHSMSDIRPYWDLMLRSSKQTIFERLEDLQMNVEWSQLFTERRIRENLTNNLSRQQKIMSIHEIVGTKNAIDDNLELKNVNVEYLIKNAIKRIDSLWNTDIIQALINRYHKQWMVFERTEYGSVNGIDLYCGPDIAVKIQNHWHLIRIDMQGKKDSCFEEEEAMAMVSWIRGKYNLPVLANKYVIRIIAWRYGFWNQLRFNSSEQKLTQSNHLIESDINQMQIMLSKLGDDNSMSQIPLAKKTSTCRKCALRESCPGGSNLSSGIMQQSVLELAEISRKGNSKVTY